MPNGDMPNGENKENTLIKVKSLILGSGSEQIALDCDQTIQKEIEDTPNQLWKATGAGKRIGNVGSWFAVDVTIYKGVITKIKSGVLSFNMDQQKSPLNRMYSIHPWTSGTIGDKYWLTPLYDHHLCMRDHIKKDYAEKKAKNS